MEELLGPDGKNPTASFYEANVQKTYG